MDLVFKSPDHENYFTGYWDKSPFDSSSSRLLACRPKFINRIPGPNDILELGLFDWKSSNSFIKICETKTWNWQQGCMLQWLGGENHNKIIYNDRSADKFVSIIYDVETNEKSTLPMAYYSATSDGRTLLCIDHERHCFYRSSYSYTGVHNPSKHKPYLKNDGIWRIDVETKTVKQIITLEEMVNITPLSNMKDAIHYLEHIVINPTNDRFLFLHRWLTTDGVIFSRLYSAKMCGSDKKLLNDSGRMSHNCWRNDKEVVGWGGLGTPFSDLRKNQKFAKKLIKALMPFYRILVRGNAISGNNKMSRLINGDSYLLFQDQSGMVERLDQNTLKKDGHPSFSRQNDVLMITDTYPDPKDNYQQQLILYDMRTNEIISQIKLDHLKEFASAATRCDLHPKWSIDGKYVAIDTLETQKRSIYVYEI